MLRNGMPLAQIVLLAGAIAMPGQEPTIEPAGSFGGSLSAVAVKDHYAYLGQGAHIRVLDVSDPRNPRRVGSIETGVAAVDLYIAGNLLYGVGESQFIILDVAAPAKPVLKNVSILRNAEKVLVSGTHAYICCGYSGLKILDVANPSAPVEIKQISGQVTDLWVENQRAYVQQSPSYPNPAALKIYDVSSPGNPVLLGAFAEGDNDLMVWDILLDGNDLYQLIDNGVLRVLDVSVPANPQEKGTYQAAGNVIGYQARLALNGDYLYLFDPLVILDISDPAHPVKAGEKAISKPRHIHMALPYGYFVAKGGFDVYNFTAPTNPVKEGSWQTQENTHQAVLHGAHLFVNEGKAVWVYGLQNPAEPVKVNTYLGSDTIKQIFLADNRLYEVISAWTEDKVAIYNAADPANIDPANPPFLGTYTSQGRISDFYAKDNQLILLAYTLDPETWTVASQWLEVVELAQPALRCKRPNWLTTPCPARAWRSV